MDIKEIESLITKEFKKDIWRPFIKAADTYKLIKDGDSIAVCVSGGKDSMLLAVLMNMLCKHKVVNADVRFLMIDPGFTEEQISLVKSNAQKLNIELDIFKKEIFSDVEQIGKNPCFFCSRMRRGNLYRIAKEMGCNKIALGHHYNDVTETILMGMLYGAQIQTMLPMVDSDNVEGMSLIRPMYLIHEDSIIRWQQCMKLSFSECDCRLRTHDDERISYRKKVKDLIAELMKDNDAVEANIFGSVTNIDLDKVMGYKLDGRHYDFLDKK